MEKKLKSELLELCHSIINDEREEDLVSTLTQTQMLYEKLVVLNYLQEQGDTEDDFDLEEEENHSDPNPNEISHLSIEKSPQVENVIEEKIEAIVEEPIQEEIEKPNETISISPEIDENPPITNSGKNRSLNEQMATGLLKIGLNDRIAFVKHLFNGEQQDYNRVLSNLNTMSNFQEADSFINEMIKPEYDWDGKEEYLDRLMELIRLKFGEES